MFDAARFTDLCAALRPVQARPGHAMPDPPLETSLAEADAFGRGVGAYDGLSFGDSLRLAMRRLHLSYEGLADACCHVGLRLHAGTITRFVKAERLPTVHQIAMIAPGLAAAAQNAAPSDVEGSAVVSMWTHALVMRAMRDAWQFTEP